MNSGMILNEQKTTKEKVTYYAIGFVLTLYAALLFGSFWTEDFTIGEWFNAFQYSVFTEHHLIPSLTPMTGQVVFMFELIWTVGYLYNVMKIEHPYSGKEYGDAHWGDVKKFNEQYANTDKKNEVRVVFGADKTKEPEGGVYVNTMNYWLAEGVWLGIDNKWTPNLNILIYGPPGTGKSFRIARPFISMLAGCLVVTDPKGELKDQTAQYRIDNGDEVFVVNCESEDGMKESNHFNPFNYIRCESDILSITQILFKATKDPDNGSSDAFFEGMAEVLCNCIMYLIFYFYPPQERNWRLFVKLLNSTACKADENGKIDNSDPDGIYNRFVEADVKWKNGEIDGIKHTDHFKGFEDLEKIYTGAHETGASIVQSLDQHCKYMKLDCVVDLLSDDEINITDSFGYCKKTKKCSSGRRVLYIITSEDKRFFDWIPSMIYSLFFDELYHLTGVDKSMNGHLVHHLTFLMDEFANVTLPDSFVEKLSTMRSREMSAVVIIQNFFQLKEKYPKNDMDKNLLANMCTKIILGCSSNDDAEEISKMIGKITIHKQTTGETSGQQGSSSKNEDVMERFLLPAQDVIQKITKDGFFPVIITGTDPLWVPKVQFQKSPLLPLLTRKAHPYIFKRETELKVQNYDFNKSACEQIPDFLVGEEAEKYLKKCEEDGIAVRVITEQDVDNLSVLHRRGEDPTGNAATDTFWKKVQENSDRKRRADELEKLDYDSYDDAQIMVVQRLRNASFTGAQINKLNPLIRIGTTYDDIVLYFNPEMDLNEIDMFSKRLADAKSMTPKHNIA